MGEPVSQCPLPSQEKDSMELSGSEQSTFLTKTQMTPLNTGKASDGRNRYLDLFTQLNIIEDSFEFVRLVFHFDPFQCVYAGSSFEKVYGYSCKDIYERTDIFYEVAHPDDADFLMQQIKALLKNGYNEFTYRIITKNSEVKYLKMNAWCQQDENRSHVISCYQKDITPQMETGKNLKKSLQKHHHISDIAITLNSVDDFELKLQLVINKIGRSIQADQVSLYEIDDKHRQMVCRVIWAKQDVITPAGIIVEIPPLKSLPEYINTLQFSAGDILNGFMRYWEKPAQVQSLILVPIRIKQKMFGFVELVTVHEKRKWSDDDLSFVGTTGNMMASFYDRKNINDELNLNYLNQSLLANVSSRLNQHTDDKGHVLQEILDYIGKKKPGIEHLFIYRYNAENGYFRKMHEYQNPVFHLRYNSREEYNGILFAEVIPSLNTGTTYVINDIAQLQQEIQFVLSQLGIKSILIIPLFVEGQFYGVYGRSIYSHYHTWKKCEIETCQSFALSISHFIERQSIVKKLRDSEQKFKDISGKLPGCVFQATLSSREEITVDYLSPQFEQWTGSKPLAKSHLEKIQQAIHPNDYEAFSKFKKELENLHTEISFEGRFYFPVIGFKWLIVKVSLFEIKPSGDRIYNGLLIDVTGSKQTELKLADANVSIQSIINNLETGVLLVDDHDQALYVNEKLLEMLASVGVFDVEANQYHQILNATYDLVRDGAGLRTHTSNLMKNHIEERGKELFLYKSAEFITRDYIPVFRDQRFFAHLFIFNNITHAKLQELEVRKAFRRVRTIIDYSDIGVLLLSENEKILIVNEQFLRMHHMEGSASQFVNQPFRNLWTKVTEDIHLEGISFELIRDAVHSGKRIINREIIINGVSTLKCFIEPVADDSQLQKGMHETLIQVIDITAQKNIEHTLRKAKEEAEVIANAKSHILMTMSHEIRTPLNGILGFSSMLKESLGDPYQREMAEVIDQSGRRLLETLNAILDFSVIQSDKKTLKITSVSVNSIVQEQVSLHRAIATQKGLYLYAEIKGHINIAISEQALYKILHNIINNAIKYTIKGGIKVEACIATINDSEWLELKVIDTGVGIDEFKHKTIFEPFRQESEGYGRAFEGAGLGLSLVKEYVQKMNGKIGLTSRKSEGSTFTVLLPNVYYNNNDMSTEIIGLLPELPDTGDYGFVLNI